MNRNNLTLIIVAVLIVLGVFALYNYYGQRLVSSPSPSPSPMPGRVIYDPRVQYPPGLPAGLPIDKPIDVIDNSETAIGNQGVISVQYLSADEMSANAAKYHDYLRSHGWKILTETQNSTSYVISAEKSLEKFSYTFSLDLITQKHLVSIQYTHLTLTDEQKKLVEELMSKKEKK